MIDIYFDKQLLKKMSELLEPDEKIKSGNMFGFPGFYINKKLSICVYHQGFACKLPEEEVRKLVQNNNACEPFCPDGKRIMRQWVYVKINSTCAFAQFTNVITQSINYVEKLSCKK